MIEEFIIYLDMDGVIADFDRHVKEICGVEANQLSSNEKWEVCSSEQLFFAKTKPMKDAKVLLDFLAQLVHAKTQILSSTGARDDNQLHQRVVLEKMWFLNEHFPRFEFRGHNFVKDSKDKAMFANKNTILIDDRAKCTEPFIAAGGRAILHTSAQDTIAQLMEMLTNAEN